jgi:hypothetical protein
MRHETERAKGLFEETRGRLARALEDGAERDVFRAIEDGASLSSDGDWNPLAKAFDLCRLGDETAPRMISLLLSMGADPSETFEWPREGYKATPASYAVARISSFSRNPSVARDSAALECLSLLLESGAAAPSSALHCVLDATLPDGPVLRATRACCAMGLRPEIGDYIRAMNRPTLAALEELAWGFPSSDARDRSRMTPLHHAADEGNDYALEILLDAGASVDSRSEDGSTPLMRACSSPRATSRTCAILLRAGAEPTLPDEKGVSALEMAFSRGFDSDKSKTLAEFVSRRSIGV